MLILALAVIASADATPPMTARSPMAVRCSAPRTYTAGSAASAPRRLGELPPGKLMFAVNKMVDGCPVNVLMQRAPSGGWVEEPAPAGAVTKAPAQGRSKPQRRLERDR